MWLVFSVILPAQQYVFRAYRQAEGLKNLDVNQLAQDRNGFLWAATENGVFRFLGSGFERFGPEQGIAELDVRALLVDPGNTVWAGTIDNLYRWDGKRFAPAGGRAIHVTTWNRIVAVDARRLLIVDHGRIYRLEHDEQGGTISYLPVFSPGQIAANTALGQISSVSVVHDPLKGIQVWIGCGKKLYSWVEGSAGDGAGTQTGKVAAWGRKQGLEDDTWEGVFLDREGTLWAGGLYHVAVLLRQAKRFADRSIPGSTAGNAYGHAPLIEDREGRVLAPSEDGIARWDGTGWHSIGRSSGLELTGRIEGMVFDAAGDPWLATYGDGLYCWEGYEDWEGWNDGASLPSMVVWDMVPTAGRMFVGTDKGPAWIDARTGASGLLSSQPGWTFGPLDTMGPNKDGTLWGGTFSAAVLRIDPKTGKTEQTAKLPAFITRTVKDSFGRVFFTTNLGIFVRGADQSRSAPQHAAAADPLLTGDTRVNDGCESPDHSVWFITTKSLLRVKDNRWSAPPIHGMPKVSGVLLDMACTADGSIWITGQQTGTWKLTPESTWVDAWKLELPKELEALTPVAIIVDGRGWVWLGTDAGLLAWNGKQWRQFTQESGLIWNDVNQGAMTAGADGSLWIGTSGGVAHLLHPERVFDPVPLNAVITEIRRGTDIYPAAHEITLPWSSLPLSFQISSSTTRNRSQLLFDYRVDGTQHSDWIENRDGMAMLSNLAPGSYTFIAEVHNLGLNSSSPAVKVRVVILPPWWRSWWFLTLCCLAGLFLFVLGDRLRARQLLARGRQLEYEVKKRTEELEERISEARVAEEKIKKLAFYDPLTHLPNRRLLSERLLRTLAGSLENHRRGAVLFIDVDNFKAINDTLGHKVGDLLLQEVAMRLVSCLRERDTVARLAGDEFVVVLEELSWNTKEAAAQAQAAAEKILSVICRTYQLNGRECLSTSSVGITVIGEAPDTIDNVLQRADIAMYQAKQAGGNTLHFFAPALQLALNARAALESEIRRALSSKQFALYYQPQLDCGQLVGAEALVRWKHPVRGIMAPGKFISLAEETGLILPLGNWVLETACRQIAAWAGRDETAELTVAVNISARQLRKPDFVEQVLGTVDRTGANPLKLKLELTESMLVENIEEVISRMMDIKSHGIGFSLDDFGTGYSSLSYLKRLPLDQLKIDRSFVRDIVEDLSSRAIAQSVISLGQVMNMSVIAEGVETEEQFECLSELGCDAFQGYLFGCPVPLEEFEMLLPVYRDLIAALPVKAFDPHRGRQRPIAGQGISHKKAGRLDEPLETALVVDAVTSKEKND